MNLQESIRRILREEAINFKNVLIPVKLTGKLHHRTTYKNRESIQKNGLLPKVGQSTLNYMSHNFPNTEPLPMVFASDPEYAFFGGDVWEIDLRKINNVWYKDPIHEGDGQNYKFYVTLDPIPPSAIKLISSNEQYDDDFETYRQTGEFPKRNTAPEEPEEPVTPEEPNKWDELIGKLSDEELNLNLGDLFNLKESIRKVLREETNHNISDDLKGLSKKIGIENAIKFVGGIERFINIAYNGDIKEYYKNENIKPYYIREGNEVNMYFDDTLVQHLNLEDFGEYEKKLGKFKFGRKNDIQYSFDARLRKVNHITGKVVWKVVGMSGSSGFGYFFISKRETLAKTYRMQIFQQIIDKYNLNDYK